MNTPAHLIFGLAAFGKPDAPKIALAALAGSIIPDLSLYLMVGWHLAILGTDPQIVFRELYYSDAWMQVFAIDNSFILWGLAFGLALYTRRSWAIALTGAALLHLALDFPLHHDDGRPQFWPLTMWIYESPVSYWDNRNGGWWIGPLEALLSTALVAWIIIRFRALWIRATALVLLVMEWSASGIWRFIF
ncbi:cobalamin biosynthesis protein CobQ [Aestuariibius sp. 2305UL40-4]|uniref:cobalamin biosynthesis protein CobQ n=1 Tax=Aestuariibius violaceus TaxID=3234132 RepID=UPI00345ECC73